MGKNNWSFALFVSIFKWINFLKTVFNILTTVISDGTYRFVFESIVFDKELRFLDVAEVDTVYRNTGTTSV